MSVVMQKPCAQCPFTRHETAVRLTPERVRELALNALSSNGGSFPCHKTTIDSSAGDGEMVYGPHTKECAGSLLFAHKQGRYNQMARILGRIKAFNPETMEGIEDVFASTNEMLATAIRGRSRRGRR